MTLPEILKLVRQRWWILFLCPLIAVTAAYFISSSMTPVYESEATVMVEHGMIGGGTDLAAIQAAERRTQTFNQLARTRSVLAPVRDVFEPSMSLGEFRGKIAVTHTRDTQLLSIAAQDPDPERAAEIANAITEEFRDFVRTTQAPMTDGADTSLGESLEQIQAQIEVTRQEIETLDASESLTAEQQDEQERLEGLLLQLEQAHSALMLAETSVDGTEANVGSQVFIVEAAAASDVPVSPRTRLNTGIAGVLGLLLGAGLMLGVAYVDDKVKTEDDLRRLIERPVIGTVPMQDLPDQMESIHAGRSISGEIFRGLRTNLQFTMVDRSVKSLVVTSVHPGEGKTTVAANLAIVLAQGGQRVILVDADMRRPRIHNMFHKVRNDRGLSNLLLQSPAVIESMVQSTTISNLKVLTTGPIPPNPPDLFGSARMRALVGALEDSADIIIFDSPPLALSESLLLASLTDGILFVVRSGKIRTSEIASGAESAEHSGVPILGAILNGVPADSQSAHRVYQQYYPLVSGEEDLPTPKRRLGWLTRVFTRSA